MSQKYGHLANLCGCDEFTCEVCATFPVTWDWTDQHGEAVCMKCGSPYQLLHYEGEGKNSRRVDKSPQINIKAWFALVLKRYWEETGQFTGLGSRMSLRDYPECVEGQEKFNAWLEEHPELKQEPADEATS